MRATLLVLTTSLLACSNVISLKSDATKSPVHVVYPGTGHIASLGRSTVLVKTHGTSPAVAEMVAMVGAASPMTQTLPDTDSLWYVREGELTLHLPAGEETLGPGSVAFIPRNVPHSFSNHGASSAQVVLAFAPAGVEAFYDALAEAHGDNPAATPSPELLGSLGQKHGILFGMTPMNPSNAGVVIKRTQDGRKTDMGPNQVVVKAGAGETDGKMGALEVFAPTGRNGMPSHRTRHTDIAWYVLEGEMTVKTPDRTVQLPVGTLMQVPRGVPLAYENSGTTTAHVLMIFAPGGFERFYEELGKASLSSMVWPPPDNVTQPIANRFGVEMAAAPRSK